MLGCSPNPTPTPPWCSQFEKCIHGQAGRPQGPMYSHTIPILYNVFVALHLVWCLNATLRLNVDHSWQNTLIRKQLHEPAMLNASTKLCELVQPYHKDHVASFLKVFCCSNCTTCQVCSRCGFFVALFLTCSCALCAMWIVCICVQVCMEGVGAVFARLVIDALGLRQYKWVLTAVKLGCNQALSWDYMHSQMLGNPCTQADAHMPCMWAALVPEILFYNYIWEIRFCFYPKPTKFLFAIINIQMICDCLWTEP